jgi:hypothetical protein
VKPKPGLMAPTPPSPVKLVFTTLEEFWPIKTDCGLRSR